jgi:hypothetical protein
MLNTINVTKIKYIESLKEIGTVNSIEKFF